MRTLKNALAAALLALLPACAVVSYNHYNISTSVEDGANWQSLEGHDLDVGLIKAPLSAASANVVFSKPAGHSSAAMKMLLTLYNHNKLLWMPDERAGRLAIDGKIVNLQGGSGDTERRLELQDNSGAHQDLYVHISSLNEKAARKVHATADLSVSATERARFSVDRDTVARICQAQKVQLQVWNSSGEYCVFLFPAALKEHLAALLVAP